MARKKMATPEPAFEVAPADIAITPVPFGARAMVTIEDDTVWPDDLTGDFVRLKFSAERTDEEVDQARERARQLGARLVRVLPRPKAALIVKPREETRARETQREACLALVETVATQNRDALKTEVEAVMAKVGI